MQQFTEAGLSAFYYSSERINLPQVLWLATIPPNPNPVVGPHNQRLSRRSRTFFFLLLSGHSGLVF